jgi:hypothetical protein
LEPSGEKLAMPKAFLSDDQWRLIEPLLPKRRSAGRPWAGRRRRVLEGILWGLKIGARWRAPHGALRRAPVGDGCVCEKRMMSGWTSGVCFCVGLMLKAACNGTKWMVVFDGQGSKHQQEMIERRSHNLFFQDRQRIANHARLHKT